MKKKKIKPTNKFKDNTEHYHERKLNGNLHNTLSM